jgi:hypothetical protein
MAGAAWLTAASTLPGQTLNQDYRRVVVDGRAGAYEAFPDIVQLNDGRLMTVFYAGYSHVSLPDGTWPNGGRVSYVLSSDQGKSWSTPKILYDTSHDDRDPSISVLPDGRLAANYFDWPSGDVYVVYSSDVGKTWTSPQYVYERHGTSSPIRPLSTGRLALPMYRALALSDNNGGSWQTYQIPYTTATGQEISITETDVFERSNGDLFAIHRTDGGTPMYFNLSSDKGQTWTSAAPMGFSGHSPYLMSTREGILLLAYRGVIGNEQGWDTRVRYSLDEGQTWSDYSVVDNVTGAYPSMVQLDDGSVLITYYEEGAGSNIRARRFSVNASGINFLSMAKTAQGTTIYNENFARTLVGSSSIQNYGWHYLRHDGTALTNETGGAANIANSNGASVEHAAMNSNPLTTGNRGYLFMGGSGSGAENLIFTDEYSIDPAQWNQITLSWQNSGDAPSESFRPALRMNGEWYVTTDDISAVTASDWQNGRIVVEVDLYKWSELDISAVGLILADSPSVLPSSTITAFGLFSEGQLGTIRIDNFRVTGIAAPEPSMSFGAIGFASLIGSRFLRRQANSEID